MARKNKQFIFENIEVTDAGAQGKTIAKAPDGCVIFLSNTVPGDIVDIKTGKKRKAYFEGTAIKFHKYSEKRTQPVCRHFEFCGGCKWQDMAY
ncbi:MAG: TRAM domain-containing protein, partial [Lutibacter sp.]